MLQRIILIGLLAILAPFAHAQEADLVLTDEEEAMLLELETMDSISFLTLLDSLLSFEPIKSSWSVRAGYNGQVLAAGRDLGVNQYGFSPGISYYHKSGFYGDLSGYWNSEFDPKYNLTVATLGYLGIIDKHFSYSLSYDHSFFSSDASNLTNSISGNLTFNRKILLASIDYSFFFGESTAHRITPGISGYFKIPTKSKVIDRILIMPTVSVLFGNQDIINIRFNDNKQTRTTLLLTQINEQRLRGLFNSGLITRQQLQGIILLRNLDSLEITDEQNEAIYNFLYTEEVSNAFGLMNYYLTLPVGLYHQQFGLMVSYTYNIPVPLPGEVLELENTGYLSIGFNYTFGG